MQYIHHSKRLPRHPAGETGKPPLRVDFDRRLKLEFHGSRITSDAGLLAYRELDDALGLTEIAGEVFQDNRTGKNGRHGMTGQFRQSLFGRVGGYDAVNDADRLGRDPAMRWIVGGKAIERQAASTSRRVSRNVKRWRNASMALRWTAAGMLEAKKGFRRINACRQLPVETSE